MTLFITVCVVALASYLGYRVGERRTLGKIEIEKAEAEEVAYQRSRRPGSIRLSTMQIKR